LPPQPSSTIDLAAWKQQDYAQMAHARELTQHLPPADGPVIEPYHPAPSPWYERWRLPGWAKKLLGAKKALGNTSIQSEEWAPDRYALSTRNPNIAQRGLRWLQGKWQQGFGEPPSVLDKIDDLLESGGALADHPGEMLDGFGLKPGGGYHAETIGGTLRESVIKSARSPKAFGIAGLVSVAQNVFEYGFGSKKAIGIWSPEFLTSTVVDFAVNMLLGLATAGIVALAVTAGMSIGWVGVVGLAVGFGVGLVWNWLDKKIGEAINGQKGVKGTDLLKQRWAQAIRQDMLDTASGSDDLLEDWPSTPDGLDP